MLFLFSSVRVILLRVPGSGASGLHSRPPILTPVTTRQQRYTHEASKALSTLSDIFSVAVRSASAKPERVLILSILELSLSATVVYLLLVLASA